MSENAAAIPLAGSEIVEAIAFKLKEQLARDCYLSPNAAYEYFTGEITVKIIAVDCGRQAPVTVTIEVAKGDPAALESGEGYKIESTEDIEKQAPNVVRRETGQSVPVTVADGAGKTETKNVKYQRQPKPAQPSKGVKTPVPAPAAQTPTA